MGDLIPWSCPDPTCGLDFPLPSQSAWKHHLSYVHGHHPAWESVTCPLCQEETGAATPHSQNTCSVISKKYHWQPCRPMPTTSPICRQTMATYRRLQQRAGAKNRRRQTTLWGFPIRPQVVNPETRDQQPGQWRRRRDREREQQHPTIGQPSPEHARDRTAD